MAGAIDDSTINIVVVIIIIIIISIKTVNLSQLPTIVSFYRRTFLPCSLFHVPTLVSAIGHSQLLDHGCGTAFCPTYYSLTLPSTVLPCVKTVFVWLTETPAPIDCSLVYKCFTYLRTYLLTYISIQYKKNPSN